MERVDREDVEALRRREAVEEREELVLRGLVVIDRREDLLELVEDDEAFAEFVEEGGEARRRVLDQDRRQLVLLAHLRGEHADHQRLPHALVAGENDAERAVHRGVAGGDPAHAPSVAAVDGLLARGQRLGLVEAVAGHFRELDRVRRDGEPVESLD